MIASFRWSVRCVFVALVDGVEMVGLLAALTFFRCFLRLVPTHEASESMDPRLVC